MEKLTFNTKDKNLINLTLIEVYLKINLSASMLSRKHGFIQLKILGSNSITWD